MGCLENWQILIINPDFIFILYNCVGQAIGEVYNAHMFMYCKLCFYAAFVRFNLLVIV